MANQKALNPPPGQCRQCWFHAYASREAHKTLRPGEDCQACINCAASGHAGQIVR
ncbi:pRL2-8 [Streptomyces sp. NBC_01453]|uniref:pRL2-8 n=1 Tax=Streptomyces sp. NBC_01453 TaxID=2903873 RepID=UPI002E2E88A9|nr:pRL2-8 [Streptomyces sp. NBC_01453]